MTVESKAGEKCTVALKFKVEADETKEPYKGVVRAFVRNARVPGFRPGKTPEAIILQRFEKEIKQEAQGACFRKFYPAALEEAKVKALNLLRVEDVSFSPEMGFSAAVVVEVKPEFKLPKYKKLSIDKLEVKVTDKDVDGRVEGLRKAYAQYEAAAEGAAVAEGDFVQIDYKGTVDGKPILEAAPEAKAVAGAEGFWMQAEEGHFLPEIVEAVKGMKAGETKTVDVKFPEDAAPEPLKGKKAVYEVTVKAFRARILPDDEKFVKDSGAESMEKLRAEIRERMVADATAREKNRQEEYAIDLLLKKADFDVPESFVANETQTNLRRFSAQAQSAGLDADYIKENRDGIVTQARDQATRQVRLSYILAAIADEEKIEATAEETDARIALIAERNGKTPDEIRQAIVKEDAEMSGLKAQLRAEKALKLVLDESK